MGLRDMFKNNSNKDKTIKTTPYIESDIFARLRQLDDTPAATNDIAQEEATRVVGKLKERYLQEHRYAYILDRLLKHIKSGEKLMGDRDYVLAQYNYDKSENAGIKKLMFIPYLQELEKLGYYNEGEIPDEIKQYYWKYKMERQLRGRAKTKAFLVLQSMGIVNLENENAFENLDESLRHFYIEKFKNPSSIQELSDAGVSLAKEIPEGEPDRFLIQKNSIEELFR